MKFVIPNLYDFISSVEHKRRCLNNVGNQIALVIICDDTIFIFVWMILLTVWYEQLLSVAFVVRYVTCEIFEDIGRKMCVFLYVLLEVLLYLY